MRDSLRFGRVDSDKKLTEWKEFAASFDHYTEDGQHPIMPITTVSRGDKMFGYWSEITRPILFPCWHPALTTPRDFMESIEAFSNIACYGSMSHQFPNGVSYVGLDTHGLAIGRNYVEKCGYENLNTEIHRRVP